MTESNEDVIGILAYGSLIEDPGEQINQLLIKRIDTVTPFRVEYARTSGTRGNAPTLIPFDLGAPVKAQILVLRSETSIQVASNILYQRETRKNKKNYSRPSDADITSNTVLIETLTNFENIKTVLYTKIGSNIPNLTANYLATNAIRSVRTPAGDIRRDGISYFISAKRNGIETILSSCYEKEILRLTSTLSLEEAYSHCMNQKKKDSIHEAGHIVLAKLFEDDFIIKSMTLNPQNYEKSIDISAWRAGTQISARVKPLTPINADKLVVIMWGGLCSQNICAIGVDKMNSKLIADLSFYWKQKMDQEGFGGDYEFSLPDLKTLAVLKGMTQDDFELAIIHFILTYQSRIEVWNIIEDLANHLLSKNDQYLSGNEIEQLFERTGFNDFLEKNKKSIISERY